MNSRAGRGHAAERAALAWLEARGMTAVASNFRCRFGELDLIMTDGNTLVIVEVRARRNDRFLAPEDSIDERKQGRIINAAGVFLQRHPRYADNAVRFDVVAVTDSEVRWIRDAFTVESDGTS